ncbi:MAG: sigma-70 family RNA polymerase sigma factor [Candidatus Hydrogenedentes bacterium]|nr:sigma-70 family RNA polymerase sigma factor [Candidatus Hydrogenedentota bacterium]
MPIDDATLLERWTTRRDAEAFNEIVERFADQVYGTCKRILRNDADAEDAAQECFLLLVRAGGGVRSSLGGWLHGAATNLCRDRIRREINRRARESAYSAAVPKATETTWDDIQTHVDAAIDALPGATRDAIVAHFLGRRTHAEIAADLRIGRRAVTYRIQGGLDAIRRDLARKGVTLSAAALGPLFAANASTAPLSLKASLGKLAIAAGTTGSAGTVTTTSLIGSLLIMKTKISIAAIVLALLGVGVYVASTRHEPVVEVPNPQAIAEPTIPTAIAAVPEAEPAPAPVEPTATPADVTGETSELDDLLALSHSVLDDAMRLYPRIEKPEDYASISGSVVDQAGYPVPNATVALTPSSSWGRLPGASDLSRVVSTNADGTYTIDAIDHGGSFWVAASKPGYADVARGESSSAPIDIAAGKSAAGIDFTLSTGPTIEGRLLTAAGEPVSDGLLQTLCLTGPSSGSMIQNISARTDASGYFTMGFDEKSRGMVVALRAQSPLHGAATFPTVSVLDDHAIELRLSAPAIIQGTVKYKTGAPVPGAVLNFYGSKRVDVAQADGVDPWRNPSSAGYFSARCDIKGQYAVTVDAGLDFEADVSTNAMRQTGKRENLAALAPGESRTFNPTVESDMATVQATVVGTPTGKPFEVYVPFTVVAQRDGEDIAYGQHDGPNAVKLLLAGKASTYTFQARYMFNLDVKGDPSKPYDLAPGDHIDIEVNLPDPQRFAVRAVDSAGNPVAGAALHYITTTTGTFDPRILTNDDGRADRILLMPPDCGARIWLEKPGYANAWGTLFEDQSAGTVHPEDVIVFSSGAGFEGVLSDSEDKILSDVVLKITVSNTDGQSWPLQSTTDAEGRFTIVDQAPAEVVDIAISRQDGEGGIWSAEQITLEANAITALGTLKLVEE